MIKLQPHPNKLGVYEVEYVNGALLGDIYREVDGLWVFAPLLRGGCWTQELMLAIGRILSEMNEEWLNELDKGT